MGTPRCDGAARTVRGGASQPRDSWSRCESPPRASPLDQAGASALALPLEQKEVLRRGLQSCVLAKGQSEVQILGDKRERKAPRPCPGGLLGLALMGKKQRQDAGRELPRGGHGPAPGLQVQRCTPQPGPASLLSRGPCLTGALVGAGVTLPRGKARGRAWASGLALPGSVRIRLSAFACSLFASC